ncbi:retention module-containing protein [Pseudomonas sp. 273]|uniref:retention module-containing protein n=1 Tax=Pseudomonas sp. 273 TaxID=75692 RepID=UPI0023D8BDA8|nr:retention module-containing protein [Pseudomonas sp. 273]
MSSVVAVVKSVIGQVLAVSAEGQRRVLVEGDRIFLGDLVQTGDAGAVALKLPDGRVLDLGRDSQLSANELAPQAPSPAAAAGSTEELQKAIAAGADPTQTLAPPRPARAPAPVAAARPAAATASCCWRKPAATSTRASATPPAARALPARATANASRSRRRTSRPASSTTRATPSPACN